MYLVLFLDQHSYEFNVSLYPNLAAAVAAYEALLRRFVLKPGETLPPKAIWGELGWRSTTTTSSMTAVKIRTSTGSNVTVNSVRKFT